MWYLLGWTHYLKEQDYKLVIFYLEKAQKVSEISQNFEQTYAQYTVMHSMHFNSFLYAYSRILNVISWTIVVPIKYLESLILSSRTSISS